MAYTSKDYIDVHVKIRLKLTNTLSHSHDFFAVGIDVKRN